MPKLRKKTKGTGVGQGHGGHTDLPALVQVDLPANDLLRLGMQPNSKAYQMGDCYILRSFGIPFGYHLSISHPTRYPTWDEVAKARYELIPNNILMVMVLPPKEVYVDIHTYCFHLHHAMESATVFVLPPLGEVE